jgi:hypothetical protein
MGALTKFLFGVCVEGATLKVKLHPNKYRIKLKCYWECLGELDGI